MTNTAKAKQPEITIHTDLCSHDWGIESRHWTSEGEVLYQRCSICSTRRMRLRAMVD
ncbi:hypothetical protein [Glutamicibacter uratoxydans]|uniref:hypothetical protein n=1 Tax=Glutamicibacter uratoxydans TaxID=43667 RepID=UPI0014774226|nr:hypothetical protein [Glutamicibacter uratoxydans]